MRATERIYPQPTLSRYWQRRRRWSGRLFIVAQLLVLWVFICWLLWQVLSAGGLL